MILLKVSSQILAETLAVCLQKMLPSIEATETDGDCWAVIGQLTTHSCSPSVLVVNCNTVLKTAMQNFERLMTLSKRLHGQGVGYMEYYNGTLRVTYESKLTPLRQSVEGGLRVEGYL